MNLTAPWTAKNGHANGTHDKIEDVRNALGREADHLAQVAAQIGRDAGTHADVVARDVAHDAQKQTNAAVGRIADLAAAWAPAVAAMGRQRVKQASDQASSIGHELRQVRLTTEPRRNDGPPGIAMLGGLGIGLGLGIATMYLLDPERGRGRRAALKARFDEWLSNGRAAATQATQKINSQIESVTSGGVDELPASTETGYETPSYETWPEGTRVPTV